MYNSANVTGGADPRLERTEDGRDFLEPAPGVTRMFRANADRIPAYHLTGRHTPTLDEYMSHAARQREREEGAHTENNAPV